MNFSNLFQQSNLIKIQKLMLFLAVIALPIILLSTRYQFLFIGFKLTNYFLIFGLLIAFFEILKYKTYFFDNKIYKRFFLLFIFVQLITLILVFLNYAYWDKIDIFQMDKLQKALIYLKSYGFNIAGNTAIKIYMALKNLKNMLIDTILSTYLVSLFIYYLFKKDFDSCFKFFSKSFISLMCLFISYSIFEIMFLFDSSFGKSVLEFINPLLYDVKFMSEDNFWYPPILWYGQLRSLCLEPSYFGILSVIILPFIFIKLLSQKINLTYLITYFISMFMIFLTNSRTALILLILCQLMLYITVLFYWKQYFLKRLVVIFLLSVFVFSFSSIIFGNKVKFRENTNQNDVSSITAKVVNILEIRQNYIVENLLSITSLNKRSNFTRVAIFLGHLNIGLAHPIFGTGFRFNNSYVVDYMPKFVYSSQDLEMQYKLDTYKKQGPLSIHFLSMNYYIDIFSSTGTVGLAVFFIPIIYIIFMFKKQKDIILKDSRQIALLISFIVQLTAMMISHECFSYYILLGAVICMFYNNAKNKITESSPL